MSQPTNKPNSLESLEDVLNKIISVLHDIKAYGGTIKIEQRGTLRKLVGEASNYVDDVKGCLLDSVVNQLSTKQLSVLIGNTFTGRFKGQQQHS